LVGLTQRKQRQTFSRNFIGDEMLTNQAPAPRVMNLTRAQMRAFKRNTRAQQLAAAGLNGKRAVARRQRQIAAGSLRAENGLVVA
jgi:hypothetical protein